MVKLKDNIVYNKHDNKVMVRTNGDLIYIICKEEEQVQPVMNKMVNDNCILSEYEEWDEDDDMRWILTFRILDEFELKPDLN
tara:strand:- start:269 stop:514 length:246 start_codon:yes stop_codon:yes gene_type:complete